uniref:EF-hand domain-containing protein n=1 Tax=Romanomermis culicivorax TaxID=13658 RepID=A0A915HH18_ROMCU
MAQKKLTGANDKIMDIGDIVMALLPMYETIQQNHKDLLKSLPLAIDLCLNWLLNIFDPVRNGILRVLSFKVVLTLMCHATLEDKYKCKQLFCLYVHIG